MNLEIHKPEDEVIEKALDALDERAALHRARHAPGRSDRGVASFALSPTGD